ncbi:O-antigen ligase family protein [Nakamurella sp. GG22]
MNAAVGSAADDAATEMLSERHYSDTAATRTEGKIGRHHRLRNLAGELLPLLTGVSWPLIVAVAAAGIVIAAMVALPFTDAVVFIVLGVVAITLVVLGLCSPQLAMLFLLVAMFLRLALPSVVANPFIFAFGGLVASFGLWLSARSAGRPRLGSLEGFMVLYVLWNIYSMFAPHLYGATYPLTGETIPVYRFILTGTVIPFVVYFVGRTIYRTVASVQMVLWAIVAFGAYSALVSIFQFYAPALVWPRYIVEAPLWEGRANGVFNQPVVNGIVLTAGFIAAIVIIGECSRSPRWSKILAAASAIAMAYGVYLTHTRAVWLSFLVVVTVGLVFGKGIRAGFAITLTAMVVAIAVNWSEFTSDDRSAGGVASANELEDRLNGIATSIWAFEREPIVGWGIGRFTAVNTLHHQQWSQDVLWKRGLGIASHFNELGILVELGVIGLTLWLLVLVFLIKRMVFAIRTLPPDGLCGRNLGLMAVMLLGVLLVAGFTVDLRFFDFPTAMVFLVVGITVGLANRLCPAADGRKFGRIEKHV